MKTMKIIIMILLGVESVERRCDSKLTETYGIMSLLEPSKDNIVFCPTIKASCCPSYEQFKMFVDYNKNIKPHYVRLQKLIPKQLNYLKTLIHSIMVEKPKLAQSIKKINDRSQKREALDLFDSLQQANFTLMIDKAIKHHQKASSYIASLKSTFFCTICDYQSQKFINLKENKITFSDDSCDDLVKHTILFSNILNRGLVIFLQNLSMILNKISPVNSIITVPGIEMVNQSIKECVEEFSNTDSSLSSCRQYCSYYRLNKDQPVYEGYPEFLMNMIVQIKQFSGPMKKQKKKIKKSKVLKRLKKPKNKQRILEGIKALKKFKIHQKINVNDYLQRKKNRLNVLIQKLNKFKNERLLGEKVDELNPQEIVKKTNKYNPFNEDLVDPQFDDYMMTEMMKIQRTLSSGKIENFEDVILRYIAKNYQPEIENIDDDQIFKQSSKERVNLENLNSEYSFSGINFNRMIKEMDWSLTMKDIILSLSGQKVNKKSESFDKNLLNFLNHVDNKDVTKFHKDNFLVFKDIKESHHQKMKNKRNIIQMKVQEIQLKKEMITKEILRENKVKNVVDIIKKLKQQEKNKIKGKKDKKLKVKKGKKGKKEKKEKKGKKGKKGKKEKKGKKGKKGKKVKKEKKTKQSKNSKKKKLKQQKKGDQVTNKKI